MAEETIYSFVIESIGDLVSKEAEFLLRVDDKIGILQQELKQISWFLRDKDANQERRKRVLYWVLQARDLGCEAEDLIETYAFKIASRRRGGVAGKIMRFAYLLNETYLRHKLGSDIDSLLKKISDMTKNINEYGIKSIMENKDSSSSNNGGGSNSSDGPLLRRTYSIVAAADDIFIGVEKDADKLADILVGDEYRVVGMCGMGGIGKTTLARKVYHHPKVRSHFEGFVWVCISQQWNKNDILSVLMPRTHKDSRCLVVLDNIWTVDAWESIKHVFTIGARGSKILLTTRDLDVLTKIDVNGFLHEPQLLSTDESWELLCRKGVLRRYVDPDFQEYHKFEEVGKDMVTHCGGLPLAVVVLGGILGAKSSYSEWEKVHRNIKSFLGNGKDTGIDQGKISHVLTLSYDDLPFKLKPCFLYFSKYADDEVIELEPLYQIWMAEGMISAEDRLEDETMMEVAERYLGELSERCMVFIENEKKPSYMQLKSCRLHDLMRELCLLKAREENFLELAIDGHYLSDEEPFSTSRSAFRLAINIPYEKYGDSFVQPTNVVCRRLRSFMIKGASVEKIKVQFGKFMLLRVLCLESCDLLVASYLKSICTLVHLRYLSLRNSYFAVPSSISCLKHLHSLDLRDGKGVVLLSIGIESLEQLKHLYLPNQFTCSDGKGRKLGLQRLRKLEILENFHSDQCDATHLSALTNLLSLFAIVSNTKSLKLFLNQVCNLSQLRFLSLKLLRCFFLPEEELSLLRGLFSLNCLITLKIRNCRISRLPAYEPGFCKNLHTLSWLRKVRVPPVLEDPFSTLEKFPNLINLSLRNCFVGREMSTHVGGFPKLRFLRLKFMLHLEKWTIEDGAMPHLSHLYIGFCDNLKTVPEGFRFLTLLKELEFCAMNCEFKSRIQVKGNKEGADFGIVRHIPSICFYRAL